MLEKYPTEERPDPIPERVGLGIFTDREREMDSLMEWVEKVAQKFGRSQALVSHRRYGKTAILERLYNRLFWERDDVMPFYFELHDGIRQIWMKELAEMYLYSFLQQFLAYRTRDAKLAFGFRRSPNELYELAEKTDETLVMGRIDWWRENTGASDAFKINTVLKELPHSFAVETGLSIIVMFDEFQRLNQVLYYDEACTRQCLHYTDGFSGVVESSRAPMLIAGSQVTMLTEEALTGAMLGRVTLDYIERLPLSGAVELVIKFAQRSKLNVSLDLAYMMSRLVDGHPYYIWCLFHSKHRERDLTTEKGIQETLTFEVENRAGHINEFWRYHFAQNMETFNLPHARQMVFYLTQYGESEVRVEKLMEDLALPLSLAETNETLRKLIWCDLVREHGDQFYGGLSDPLLARVLSVEYSWEIEQLTRKEAVEKVQTELAQELIAAKGELIDKLRGELNYWVGHVGEVFVKKFMADHFTDQIVDGAAYFNHSGEIQLSRFVRLFPTTVQPFGAPNASQIDVYALPADPDARPWVVEVKNWQTPVSKPHVEHFWEAAQNLAEEKDHAEIVCWFHARSGFTQSAKAFLEEKGILSTDEAGLTQMLRDFQVVEKWRSD